MRKPPPPGGWSHARLEGGQNENPLCKPIRHADKLFYALTVSHLKKESEKEVNSRRFKSSPVVLRAICSSQLDAVQSDV